jgi:two-component system, OmpR family, osmolarity sensor histidine kinase EnvZ
MLGRLGLAGRLLAMMLCFLLAIAAIGSSIAFMGSSGGTQAIGSNALPVQSAAIVKLLDNADPTMAEQILKAANADTLQVSVVTDAPKIAEDSIRLPTVEWLVTQQLDETEKREVVATLIFPENMSFPRLQRAFSYARGGQKMQLVVPLKSGSFAVFDARGIMVTKLYGWPVGFAIGLLGSLVGIATIWAVMREARPLKQLVASVDRFAEKAEPDLVKPSGAPDIKRLMQANNAMQSRIASLIAGRALFLGGISHDLKTYLTRFRLRIEEIPDDDQRERAARDLDDMTHLLDDALVVASNTNVPVRRTSVDLKLLLASEVADRPNAQVTFKAEIEAAPSDIIGDPVALRRVFSNLVNNALTYGTKCTVTLKRDASCFIIEVEDDGPGIPESEWESVFEPFYRVDTSRSRLTGGSGLGLAIVKQVVEAHGGTVKIGRSSFGGAKVQIALPAASGQNAPGSPWAPA